MKEVETKVGFETLFKEELIFLQRDERNQNDFFATTCNLLQEKGHVNDQYYGAITERERSFPTGLAFENINIAIPHTETEFVNHPFVMINRLKNPIKFLEMGSTDKYIDVHDIWLLGIKDTKKQVGLLSFIVNLFNDNNFLEKYTNTENPKEIFNAIQNFLTKLND